ncbi:MFS transporter [Deinococcus frigens]|uniref:MFS transporter n=1 Tax=Deinococcus frigens TaxID=249403 RepID=UPI00068BF9C9
MALSGPRTRGRAVGLVFGGFTVATALGVPLGTLLGSSVGWRAPFLLVTVLAVLGLGTAWRTLDPALRLPPPHLRVFMQALRTPLIALLLLVTALQLAAQYTLFTFIAPYLGQTLAMGSGAVTATLLVFGVASVTGNLGAGQATDRLGAARTALLCLGILGLCLLGLWGVGGLLIPTLLLIAVWGAVGLGFQTPQQVQLA